MIAITPMTAADVPAVSDIERKSNPEPWPERLFREELTRSFAHALVARLGDEAPVVGYICFWIVADELQVVNFAVHCAHRRQGIGRALLGHAIAIGREHQVNVVVLEARQSNCAALTLYRSLGFRSVGERPGYYKSLGSPEAAILMELRLAPDDPLPAFEG